MTCVWELSTFCDLEGTILVSFAPWETDLFLFLLDPLKKQPLFDYQLNNR